jgi:hypothetical protein
VTTERDLSVPDDGGHAANHCRTVISARCQLHRGPVGDATLMVSKHDGTIVLDPQVASSCVISLDEDVARTLRELLSAWLR